MWSASARSSRLRLGRTPGRPRWRPLCPPQCWRQRSRSFARLKVSEGLSVARQWALSGDRSTANYPSSELRQVNQNSDTTRQQVAAVDSLDVSGLVEFVRTAIAVRGIDVQNQAELIGHRPRHGIHPAPIQLVHDHRCNAARTLFGPESDEVPCLLQWCLSIF